METLEATQTQGTTKEVEQTDTEYLLENDAEMVRRFINACKTHTLVHPETGKTIKIYDMIHVGPQEFYDKRNKEMKADYDAGIEIHSEGYGSVSEKVYDKIYRNRNSVLRFNGMQVQEDIKVPHKMYDLWQLPEVTREIENARLKDSVLYHLHRIKKDMKSDFYRGYPFLNKHLRATKNMSREERRQYSRRSYFESMDMLFDKKPFSPLSPRKKILMDMRNEIAVKHALATEKDVSLVWGKHHAPGMVRLLEAEGYHLLSSKV